MDTNIFPLRGHGRDVPVMREASTGAHPERVPAVAEMIPTTTSDVRECLMNCVVGALLVAVLTALVVAQAHIP